MKTKFFTFIFLAAGLLMTYLPAFSQSPVIVYVEGNPTCCDINPDDTPGNNLGAKLDPPASGTFTLNSLIQTCATGGTISDGYNTITVTIDGLYFSWSSTFGIDAIIVKGGPCANIYYYSPEARSGTGLHAPINPSNGLPYGLSHMGWCFDSDYRTDNINLYKTANTSWTRTYTWDISKSASPDEWDIFIGDEATSDWTVVVDQTVTDSDWEVYGSIFIENVGDVPQELTSLADVIDIYGPVTPDCGITFPYVIPANTTLECTYSVPLDEPESGENTVVLTFPGGSTKTDIAPFSFSTEPTTVEGYPQVTITDSRNPAFPVVVDGDAEFTYAQTFDCEEADEGSNPYWTIYYNTARIEETGQSSQASVQVNCWHLDVSKTAVTSYTRTWDWTIDKICPPGSPYTLMPGQPYPVQYNVVMGATYLDSDWGVDGEIVIHNPSPITAEILGLADVVAPGLQAAHDCIMPVTILPGESLSCDYSRLLPDASTTTNTATSALRNHSYDQDQFATEAGETEFSATVDVIFGAPTNLVDECVDVTDTYAGTLGSLCYTGLPMTFTYNRDIGFPEGTPCGSYDILNTASFVTNDRGITGSDGCSVTVNIPCGGCTLTPGYWKTHSQYGPAPYDNTWALLLPSGPNSVFFLSGQTYYQVLWTTSAGGNAYYILAHAYIAAKLNFLNGADPSAAQSAFNSATVLFQTKTPAQVAALKGTAKAQWTSLATTLDNYNNGLIGPGHCTEPTNGYPQSQLAGDQGITADPEGYSLDQNYPNPFSSTTNFVVTVPQTGMVSLNIYSLLGQRVATVYSGELAEGTHSFVFNRPSGMPEGMYIFRLETNDTRIIRKMTVLR